MGSSQNLDPILEPLDIRCRNIVCNHKRPIILGITQILEITNRHMFADFSSFLMYNKPGGCKQREAHENRIDVQCLPKDFDLSPTLASILHGDTFLSDARLTAMS